MLYENIGVIGYGRFGELLTNTLLPTDTVTVFDTNPDAHPSRRAQSAEALATSSQLIVPAVPISQFREVIEQITPHLQPGSVVMDVCSVKEYPVQIMLELLPPDVNIIASHPMFGPKSYESKGSLGEFKMVMVNVRCNPIIYEQTKAHFANLGIEIIEITPEKHDQLTARSQFFAQMTRFAANELQLTPTETDTASAQDLFRALSLMGSDTQLFYDMLKYNRFCPEVLDDTIKSLQKLRRRNKA